MMLMEIADIAVLMVLVLSIVLHEMAHGYAANWLGDPTARLQGRLSPNPLVHIDPLGSVIIPALLFISNAGFLFGWAKPVPYNPYNLSDQRYGEAKVAAAGPAVNLLLAFIFAMIIRLAEPLALSESFLTLASYIVFINILLALFNMLPFPPLDGSKIITALLPYRAAYKYRQMTMAVERYGFIVLFIGLFIIIQVIWPYLFAAVLEVASLMTGLTPSEFYGFIRLL
jgi:Zn-dependent protease